MRSAIVVSLLVFLVATCQSRKPHRGRSLRHNDRNHLGHLSDQSINHLAKQDEAIEERCHRGALHKCGGTFLRAYKLLNFLRGGNDAFRARCGLRTAFFECLRLTRERICANPRHPFHPMETEDFRKRLTHTLWSTRICVLGVQSFGPPG